MCLNKKLQELEERIRCLKNRLIEPTKTVKYRLEKEIGNNCWWTIKKYKSGKWKYINVLQASSQCEAEAKFKKQYLDKQIVKEYTTEQWC